MEIQRREDWADVAKGACITLVVLWHVVVKHYLQVDWRLPVPVPGAWGTLGEALLPLRMPLFFTISGVFAVSALNRPWPVLLRARTALFGYLYVLWLLVHTALLALVPDFDTARAGSATELLVELTVTPSNLWYLYALALYFTLAKALRRLPAPAVLAVAGALSAVTAAGLVPAPGNRAGLFQNLVFFLLGSYLAGGVKRLAAAATWRKVATAAVAYASTLALVTITGVDGVPGVWPVLSVVGVVLGVTAAAQISRTDTRAVRALAALGRRTLPIYVMHMPLLALLHAGLVGPMSAASGPVQFALAVAEPLVLTVGLVLLCGWVHERLTAIGAVWLFTLPSKRVPEKVL